MFLCCLGVWFCIWFYLIVLSIGCDCMGLNAYYAVIIVVDWLDSALLFGCLLFR